MKIAIYQGLDKRLALFEMYDFHTVTLEPDEVYWLYLYADKEETWKNLPDHQSRNDIIVLTRSDTTESIQNTEQDGRILLRRFKFKVDNDLPVPKVIRWAFAWEDGKEYQTFRISLHVKPRFKSVLYLLSSLVGVLFMTEIFEIINSWWNNSITGMQAIDQSFKAVAISFGFLVIGIPILKLFGFFTPKE